MPISATVAFMAKDDQVGVRIAKAVRDQIRERLVGDEKESAWIRDAVTLRLSGGSPSPTSNDPEVTEALEAIRAYFKRELKVDLTDAQIVKKALLAASEEISSDAALPKGTTKRG